MMELILIEISVLRFLPRTSSRLNQDSQVKQKILPGTGMKQSF